MKFKKHYEAELFVSTYSPDTNVRDTLRPATDQDLKDAGYLPIKEAESVGRDKFKEIYQEGYSEGRMDSSEQIRELTMGLKSILALAEKGYVNSTQPDCDESGFALKPDSSMDIFAQIRDLVDGLGIASDTEPPR